MLSLVIMDKKARNFRNYKVWQDTVDLEEVREMTHRAVSREYALDCDMTPEQLSHRYNSQQLTR